MGTPGAFYPGRRTLPDAGAFWVLAVMFLMLFFASAAASPPYPVYQAQFGFSAATLTAVFAVYVLVLLVTLLFFGSVSDFLGRLLRTREVFGWSLERSNEWLLSHASAAVLRSPAELLSPN
ncbi:MAG TPA: hypothetical protein VG142_06340 [Trebonia sp.]|nr:hypothetical protein [Trebonia sp.]